MEKGTESKWESGRARYFKMTTEIFHSMGHPPIADQKRLNRTSQRHAVNTHRALNED